MSGSVNDSADKSSIMDGEEKEERFVDIYITAEAVRDIKHKKQTEESKTTTTTTTQPPEHTGSVCVKNRSHRSVLVCLVVLCVLLLTAVIVLCVLIYTNTHQFHINYKNITQERDQLLTKYTNITEERDQLLTKYTNITEERDQLLTKYTNITEERDQLLTKYTNITEERDQLLTKYTNITQERNQLLTKYTNITEKREELRVNNNNISMQHEQLKQERKKLLELLEDGWKYYESNLYYFSSETKSWSNSRDYCTAKGADLVIINNKKEQAFVGSTSGLGQRSWVGLHQVEGTWTWVDGSTMNNSLWGGGEPNGGTIQICVETDLSFWNDHDCYEARKWICERKISK